MWLKHDDSVYDHPKVLAMGDALFGRLVRTQAWCARHKMGGDVPEALLGSLPLSRKDVARLVEIGALDEGMTFHDGPGWHCHDWEDYNPTPDQAREYESRARDRKESARDRKRRERARKRGDGGRDSGRDGGRDGRSGGMENGQISGRLSPVRREAQEGDFGNETAESSTAERPRVSGKNRSGKPKEPKVTPGVTPDVTRDVTPVSRDRHAKSSRDPVPSPSPPQGGGRDEGARDLPSAGGSGSAGAEPPAAGSGSGKAPMSQEEWRRVEEAEAAAAREEMRAAFARSSDPGLREFGEALLGGRGG